jgi:hypothetical protein
MAAMRECLELFNVFARAATPTQLVATDADNRCLL